jgi:hypothetical protein
MPNRRGTTIEPADLEQAKPWPAGRFNEAEPQERRGPEGSRDRGKLAPEMSRAGGRGKGERHSPSEWTGVNPLPPIDSAMPRFKPGDQGG